MQLKKDKKVLDGYFSQFCGEILTNIPNQRYEKVSEYESMVMPEDKVLFQIIQKMYELDGMITCLSFFNEKTELQSQQYLEKVLKAHTRNFKIISSGVSGCSVQTIELVVE